MIKKIDIDRAEEDNPDIPREFIEDLADGIDQVERGETTTYRNGFEELAKSAKIRITKNKIDIDVDEPNYR